MKTEAKYDVRAPPRRRQKGTELDEQPVFLRKAYAMISSCPAEIGGWSESGDTVVIKDAKAFSETIIPTAYKHNNFSSFVRQLNFYGFRKVKSNVLNSKDWWEFRHPHFIRGQPHLLSEIKRSLHFEQGGAGADVSELKKEVQDLSHQVHHLYNVIEDMNHKFSGISLSPSGPENNQADSAFRRKVRARHAPLAALDVEEDEEREDFLMEMEEEVEERVEMPLGLISAQSAPEIAPVPVLSAEELQALWELHEGETEAEALPLLKVKEEPAPTPQPANVLLELSQILSVLTPELKERFVDKLAENMSSKLLESQSNPAVYVNNGTTKMPEIALPLASAALGAFVMSSLQSLQGPGNGNGAPHLGPGHSSKTATVSA